MGRRFQFSLRKLLAVAAIVCLPLGGWHLLEVFGNRILIEEGQAGVPIKVRARRLRFFGPERLLVGVELYRNGESRPSAFSYDSAERSSLCFYVTEAEFDAPDGHEPWSVALVEYEWPKAASDDRWRWRKICREIVAAPSP